MKSIAQCVEVFNDDSIISERKGKLSGHTEITTESSPLEQKQTLHRLSLSYGQEKY